MPLSGFHPAVTRWFGERFSAPTEPQRQAWPVIRAGRDALAAAPPGWGKTLAAFLAAIDSLVRQGLDGPLPDETQVVYVSPLKALSNDVQKNLSEPLAEIRRTLEQLCLPDVAIRTLVRTGDTPGAERQAMLKRPPHIRALAREPVSPAHGRALARDAAGGADRDRGRDPRRGARQAGEPPRPLARAPRPPRRAPAPAHRSFGYTKANRGNRPLPHRQRPTPYDRQGVL